MIYSSANLQVVNITSNDKDVNVLSFVYFDKSGFTAGIDGKAVLAVEPTPPDYKKHFVIKDVENGSFAIPEASVREVMKIMPKDSKFKGLLEQVAVTGEDENNVEFALTDGLHQKSVTTKKHRKAYPDVKEILRPVYKKEKQKVCVNRSRLIKLLQAIDKACPDPSGETPVYLELSEDSSEIMLRAQNMKTGQIAVGIMGRYEGEWLKRSKWEKEVIENDN